MPRPQYSKIELHARKNMTEASKTYRVKPRTVDRKSMSQSYRYIGTHTANIGRLTHCRRQYILTRGQRQINSATPIPLIRAINVDQKTSTGVYAVPSPPKPTPTGAARNPAYIQSKADTKQQRQTSTSRMSSAATNRQTSGSKKCPAQTVVTKS